MMRTRLDNRSPQIDGFTLIETLVVIAVIGLVAGALAVATTTFLRNEGSVSARITESRDLQNLTNFLPRDVASARSITNAPPAGGECGSGPGGTIELHMEWVEEWLGALSATRVTYRSFTTGGNRLIRYECENSSPATEFIVADFYTTLGFDCTNEPTVIALMTFPGGNRSITATSRNYLAADNLFPC